MPVELQPFADRVVIRKSKPDDTYNGIIIIPPSIVDDQRRLVTNGHVVAIGPEVLQVSVGDWVTFGQYVGKNVKMKLDDGSVVDLDVMREGDIEAKIIVTKNPDGLEVTGVRM
uniref:Putative chaperonin n=1 Tax=viral metagenome TaxID=1070528 RepID=A0A6M3ILI4_9ZZZZ